MPATWVGDSTSGRFRPRAWNGARVYRGPNSNLYGAGAESGVVSVTTAAWNHELSLADFSRRLGKFRELAGRTGGGRHVTASSITWAPTAGCRRRMTCRTTNITWELRWRMWVSADRVDADSRHAALRGRWDGRSGNVGVLSPGEQRDGERSGPLHRRVNRQPDHRRLSQHGAVRRDAQARAVQPVGTDRRGNLRRLWRQLWRPGDDYRSEWLLGNRSSADGFCGNVSAGVPALLKSRCVGVPGRLRVYAPPDGANRVWI